MTTETTTEVVVEAPKNEPKNVMTPQEFLASLAGAPTGDQIAYWKGQAPNGRVELFTPDMKRAFILRGLSGLELSGIQKRIQGMATAVSDPELEMQIAAVVQGTLWTNAGPNNKLTEILLRTGSAGLPSTLFAKVTKLSDFMDPQTIEQLSAEL